MKHDVIKSRFRPEGWIASACALFLLGCKPEAIKAPTVNLSSVEINALSPTYNMTERGVFACLKVADRHLNLSLPTQIRTESKGDRFNLSFRQGSKEGTGVAPDLTVRFRSSTGTYTLEATQTPRRRIVPADGCMEAAARHIFKHKPVEFEIFRKAQDGRPTITIRQPDVPNGLTNIDCRTGRVNPQK